MHFDIDNKQYFYKENSTEKIDGVIATIMALDRVIRPGNDNRVGVYDDRGIFYLN